MSASGIISSRASPHHARHPSSAFTVEHHLQTRPIGDLDFFVRYSPFCAAGSRGAGRDTPPVASSITVVSAVAAIHRGITLPALVSLRTLPTVHGLRARPQTRGRSGARVSRRRQRQIDAIKIELAVLGVAVYARLPHGGRRHGVQAL